MHHVAYATDDIDSALEQLATSGVELIDAKARVGIGGSRVAFLQPRSTGRVLTEIVEPPEGEH
jgi:methylmalonyl-CoA/ethylmalonyl-CoA epimerase